MQILIYKFFIGKIPYLNMNIYEVIIIFDNNRFTILVIVNLSLPQNQFNEKDSSIMCSNNILYFLSIL
jgi:hypothetical protein